jgi:tetratricopeptide (TPR) repeat protein
MDQRKILLTLLAGLAVFLVSCGSGEEQPKPAASPPSEVSSESVSGSSSSAPPPGSVKPSESTTPSGPRTQGRDLATLRSLPPSAVVDVEIGSHFFNQGELDSALVYYRSATERDGENPANWNFLGICLARLGRTAEAEEAYQKAEEADPYYLNTYVNRGNIFFLQGDYDKAIYAYNVAVSIDSTDANTWLNLGMAYKKVDAINKAILAFNKAAECAPDDPAPWDKLGMLYFERKLYSAARERWLEAVKRDSTREDLKVNIQALVDYAESTGTR